jgi:hypothetical protein
MDNFDKNYLAGIFDGEGTITIHKRKITNRSTTYGYVFQPKVRIALTEGFEIIKYFNKVYGGSLWTRKYLSKNKDILTLNIVNKDSIKKFLDEISPLLIIKHEHALVLKEYYSGNMTQKSWKSQKIPLEEMNRRENLYLKIQLLNKKCKDITNRD